MQQEGRQLQPPSFTLYPLTSHDLKTCYQSQHCKIICNINGPYFDRRHAKLHPLFNVHIADNAGKGEGRQLEEQKLVRLGRKLQEMLGNVMLEGKYQRMVFDVSFQIVENSTSNPASFMLAPLSNLLAYTCALRCLEIKSLFACSALIFREEKILWDYEGGQPEDNDRQLILCSESRDGKAIMMHFSGEFSFMEFEKMTGAAEETNRELALFIQEKINETYELFHQ